MELRYTGRMGIEHSKAGLKEPSGLALAHDQRSLWTVSDDTRAVFRLALDGLLLEDSTIRLGVKGLEGIAVGGDGSCLYAVQEEDNRLLRIDVRTRRVSDSRPLADLSGYEAVRDHFSGGHGNKGLEGITWHGARGTLFVVREGRPRLLMEVAPALDRILGSWELSRETGFRDPGTSDRKLDVSDLCFDSARGTLWLLSDRGRRLFLYDLDGTRVVRSFPLAYHEDGEAREIRKAEGLAITDDGQRLYVVCDEQARLYVYDLL